MYNKFTSFKCTQVHYSDKIKDTMLSNKLKQNEVNTLMGD